MANPGTITRKADVTLDVVQKNTEQKLVIVAADKAIEEHLGRTTSEIVGEELKSILPENVNELIANYLEYDDVQDLAAVLSKTRKFGLLNRHGREIPFGLKIIRDTAADKEANPRFKLFISRQKIMDSLRMQLGITEVQEKDIIDTTSHLPDRASFLRHLELVNRAVREGKIKACLGLIKVDIYNEVVRNYGQDGAKALFMNLATVCRTNVREDDIVGYVAPNRVAIILLETKEENAKIPMNRIRWTFGSAPIALPKAKEPIQMTLTATYLNIPGKGTPIQVIDACDKAFGIADAKRLGGNLILDPEPPQEGK